MRSKRQGPVAPNGGEGLTLQQVMETMQALQEEVVVSRANQERIQDDLAASRATIEALRLSNEELRRDLQNQADTREEGDREPATPPREFLPFSQEIMDVVIPATFVGPKVTITGTEDPEAHLTTFHTQMMLVGGSDAVRCKLFMSTLVGTTMDWFISLPDGHYNGESLKEFLHRFGAQVVRLNLKDETMMVHAFRKGIVAGPFSESLIRNHPKTFAEIRRRAVAHIAAEGEVNEKHTCVVPTHPRASCRPQPLRVHEATIKKNTLAKQQPYQPRKPQIRERERENVPPRHDFVVELKDLIAIPNIAERLKEKQGVEDVAVRRGGQRHEVPVHGEIHTIAGGFSGGGCIASQRKRYARVVMSVEAQRPNDAFDLDLVFTKADLQDVVPHDNDPVVISVVTAGRKVHRVLVDQGSLADVMF
ncbi:uncharacterized protein [Phaseolus vulgaris]|uniref:uncharacterized protein n=1 Tax=Phaseolus vulgaris TaxID=3885 RepID=UPI0035C95A56